MLVFSTPFSFFPVLLDAAAAVCESRGCPRWSSNRHEPRDVHFTFGRCNRRVAHQSCTSRTSSVVLSRASSRLAVSTSRSTRSAERRSCTCQCACVRRGVGGRERPSLVRCHFAPHTTSQTKKPTCDDSVCRFCAGTGVGRLLSLLRGREAGAPGQMRAHCHSGERSPPMHPAPLLPMTVRVCAARRGDEGARVSSAVILLRTRHLKPRNPHATTACVALRGDGRRSPTKLAPRKRGRSTFPVRCALIATPGNEAPPCTPPRSCP